jgi:ribosome-associated translation inhibitor RaiA
MKCLAFQNSISKFKNRTSRSGEAFSDHTGENMGSSDFYVDFNIEVSDVGDEFKRETEQQLAELASSHSDMVGAAVALEKTVDTQSYDVYRVRIVVYKRPQDIVVTKQDSDPMVALRDALDALEEQVRTSREKLAEREPHRDSQIRAVYYDLSDEEIYATYAKGWGPDEILEMDRTEIVSHLMVEESLTQDAADFVADQILRVAERITSGEE